MVSQKISEQDLPTFIQQQFDHDPKLPRPDPTLSAWQSPAHPEISSIQSAKLPENVDFIVIGSGVAGLGVAKELLNNAASGSKTVTVLEARTICSSATGRNGGQLTRIPPTRHTFMKQEFGSEQAKKIVLLTLQGLQEMRKLVVEQGPQFVEESRLTELEKFFAHYDQQSWDETVEAVNLYNQEIPEDRGAYQLVSKEECATKYNLKGAYGGLRLSAGVCSPYNIITGTFANLLKQYPSRFTLEANTPVTDIKYNNLEKNYPYIVKTPRGTIRAANVVHCTNGFASHLLPGLRGKMYPRRGTMSVQSPGSRFPDMGKKQSWSFYYTPTYDDATGEVETGRYYAFQHKDSKDIWLGGNRDNLTGFITTDDSTIDECADQNLRRMLPVLFSNAWIKDDWKVRQVWSGIMCYTGDHVPFVGKVTEIMTERKGQGEWIAAGWNTYGMTNGLLCAYGLARMMLGEDISGWFPDPYVVSEERLSGPRFQGNAVLKDFFDRMGAHVIKAKL